MMRMRFYLFLLLWCLHGSLSAQTDSLPSYFFEDGKVVLEFDIRDLEQEKSSALFQVFDFAFMELVNAIRAGKEWSKNGWHSIRKGDFTYQLRKDLNDFDDPFLWHNKYLIHQDYWLSPTSEKLRSEDSLFNGVPFDPKPKMAIISKDGNTSFILPGFRKATRVILSGSFNNWNEQAIQMNKTDTGWEINLELVQGIYEYKFIVDGTWIHDPNNSLYVLNQHRTLNSILLVGETITFHLPGYLNAERVILAGSFNSWNEKAFKMKKGENGWYADVPLPPGKHYYKFIVDGKWMVDPGNKLQQPDRHGYWNSVLLIH